MAGVPDEPPTFRPSAAAHAWRWRLEDAQGAEVPVDAELADAAFPSQADAESWVGETFTDLAAQGVDRVTLLEGDRVVYGPMSLHP